MIDLLTGLLKRKDSLSRSQLLSMAQRDRFSAYLPWLTYHRDNRTFLLADNTIAYFWELTPLVYAGPKQTSALESILKQSFPCDTVMQYILYPDANIEPILAAHVRTKTRLDEVGRQAVANTADFLLKGTAGLSNIRNVPVRNFRCFLMIKSNQDLSELIPTLEEMLGHANLAPRRINDTGLISIVSALINDRQTPQRTFAERDEIDVYSRDRPLRDHIIDHDMVLDFDQPFAQIGDRKAVCLTLSEVPEFINPLRTNHAFGGTNGAQDDAVQLDFPFLYSINILFTNAEEELGTKASITMGQSAAGSFAHQISRRMQEFNRFRKDVADKQNYIKLIPTLWVFGESEQDIKRHIGRAKMVWGRSDTGGFELQTETLLNRALFIATLPGGLYNQHGNVDIIDRHIYMSYKAAARFLPVQGDFAGNGSPSTLVVGRKGQLAGLDVFAPGSTNHNYLVCAESGAGKSFFLNTLLSDHYYSGDKIRIVDLGRSYEKLCRINGGKFVDFTLQEQNQCINPLDFIIRKKEDGQLDQEDLTANLTAAANVFAEMVYSKSKVPMPEHESQLIKDATVWAYNNDRVLEGTDVIRHYLLNYKEITQDSADFLEDNIAIAKTMAYNLKDFASGGPYAPFFVGKSNLAISNDDFVVIELDDIKGDPELFSVVTLQMMNEITQDLYMSDRKTRRFILFEEAPSILKENGAKELSRLASMVDEGYRRARKYGGSFGLVMQSIMDVTLMGAVGKVALSNAAYKFLLTSKSNQYPQAVEEGLIDYKGFSLNLLTSLCNNKPNYSEIFTDTPQGCGVVRLIVDPFRYLVNTTEAREVAIFNQALDEGKTPYEALLAMQS
jgi:conjugal transfer ATP-binding protein TraC